MMNITAKGSRVLKSGFKGSWEGLKRLWEGLRRSWEILKASRRASEGAGRASEGTGSISPAVVVPLVIVPYGAAGQRIKQPTDGPTDIAMYLEIIPMMSAIS